MNDYKKIKFKVKISSILFGSGTLLVCFAGVGNSDLSFYTAMTGFLFSTVGVVLYLRNVKKLKAIEKAGSTVERES